MQSQFPSGMCCSALLSVKYVLACGRLKQKKIYEFMVDHRSYTHNLSSCEITEWITGLNGIRTHDLSDTGAVLCRLSYHWSHLGAGHIVSL